MADAKNNGRGHNAWQRPKKKTPPQSGILRLRRASPGNTVVEVAIES